MREPGHIPWIDWLKAAGLGLIVYGHVAQGSIAQLTPPIYPKQLGVAFVLFVTGFSLARERRPTGEVVFKRLFEILFFGLFFALLLSAVSFVREGRLTLSNYLPLLLGANVVFDHFPANPTTWFIGTYTQLLLLWALVLRRLRVRPWMLALGLLAEVAARFLLWEAAGPYVAYMSVANWLTVFLLGTWFGQKPPAQVSPTLRRWSLVLAGLVAVYPFLAARLAPSADFPFMIFAQGGPLLSAFQVSAVYVIYTLAAFQVARRLPCSRLVEFFARNTLVVFIAHMPIYYALQPRLAAWPYALRAALLFTVCFPVLALASEGLVRLLRPRRLRDRLWNAWAGVRGWRLPVVRSPRVLRETVS